MGSPGKRQDLRAAIAGFTAVSVGLALSAVAPLSSAATSEVLFEETFGGSGTAFSSTGRTYFRTGYVRLRGGEATSITSDMIYTDGHESLSLSYVRETYGLDAGESLAAEVSVDGGSFTTVESERDLTGRVELALPEADRFIQLRFRINGSSFFERADVSSLVVMGTTGDDECETDCGEPLEEPPANTAATIVPDPSWDCGMPGGIPDPTTGELLFSATLPVNDVLEVGQTPYGERVVLPMGGAPLSNARSGLTGKILPGSLDFNLTLPSGAREHESRYTLETGDGTLVYMRNCGVADGERTRFVADFEAPNGSDYTWLHEGRYVGVREMTGRGVRLSVYRNPTEQQAAETVQVPSDNTVRQQAWECPELPPGASRGGQVLEASVGIGGFQSVGDSKNGSRRIIPITGGSFSGQVAGNVNPGGADYQLTVNSDLTLEARYTLQSRDGETLVVRNCGDFGSGDLTLPMFEAATSGSYDWMNDLDFVGTITPGLGRVTITVFEQN